MTTGLDETVAVVTGAGRGLGAAIAIALADAGCTPVLCGRDQAALGRTASMIADRSGREAHTVTLDLADASSVEAALTSLRKTHSTIDLLVNNGAMWLEASMREYTAEEVFGVVNAAVSGTFLLT